MQAHYAKTKKKKSKKLSIIYWFFINLFSFFVNQFWCKNKTFFRSKKSEKEGLKALDEFISNLKNKKDISNGQEFDPFFDENESSSHDEESKDIYNDRK